MYIKHGGRERDVGRCEKEGGERRGEGRERERERDKQTERNRDTERDRETEIVCPPLEVSRRVLMILAANVCPDFLCTAFFTILKAPLILSSCRTE